MPTRSVLRRRQLACFLLPPRGLSGYYRHTKIIATLGPATESKAMLQSLIEEGVDVVRLNMAHGDPEWIAMVIKRIREVSAAIERQVAVMMDVKGPEIRTGPVDHPIELAVGDRIELLVPGAAPSGDLPSVSVNYPGLPEDVSVGDTVLVDSGLIRMRIESATADRVRCEVLTACQLGSRRHINLPGVQVRLPALTAKDERDLKAGIDAGIDFVALSFVRQASDIHTLRKFLSKNDSRARIVAKIEDQAGVRNMEEIVRAADGVMVARGDLGIEIDYQKLPLVQTQLVNACLADGKPVIIATHLLESMISSPMPTRAEISDVSNAVREQADAVMLSGETTTGDYPLESVQALKRIVESIEPSVDQVINASIQLREPKSKMLKSAVALARDLGDSGVVVFTRSGFLAYVLGALRAGGVPIFAFTDVEEIFRQMLLPWGVEPFLMEFSDDPETTIRNALLTLTEKGWVRSEQWLVVITNVLAGETIVDTTQLRQAP